MNKHCEAFDMKDPIEAYNHMRPQMIIDYGSYAYGHALHTWDCGFRILSRCRTCGGLILIQDSEFHGIDDDDYTDYIPVDSEEDADELNRKYNGYELETKIGRRYLMKDNDDAPHWSKEEE